MQYIDPNKVVRIYRNLRNGKLSVQQGGIVVCHTKHIVLRDAKFTVGQKGRERVLREKQKNVHAFISGYAVDPKTTWYNKLYYEWDKVYYNPYKTKHWTNPEGKYVDRAQFVDIDCEDVPLAFNYTYKKVT